MRIEMKLNNLKKYFNSNDHPYNDPYHPKYLSSSNFSYQLHFENIRNMYNAAFDYIKAQPSFHIGYDYATNKLISLAEEYGLASQRSLLELCCGFGVTLTKLTMKYGFRSTGVDLVQKQIEECTTKIENENLEDIVTPICENVLNLTTSSLGKFDLIFSEDSFSHIPERENLLDFCYETLNSRGLLVFSDLIKTEKISNEELTKQCHAWCLHPLESLQNYMKKFAESGFTILEVRTNLGKELLSEHIKYDQISGDVNPIKYFETFNTDGRNLIDKWGAINFNLRRERLQSYKHIWDGKLDYGFFILQKP